MSHYTLRSGATSHPEKSVLQHITDLLTASGVLSVSGNHYKCEAQASPNMTVKVKANGARAYILKSAGNAYPVNSDADENVTIGANASGNPRKDVIVLYIDLGASPNSDASNVAKTAVVAGTPGASPSIPDDSAIGTAIGASNPFIRLATVHVNSGASSITNSNITDARSDAVFFDGSMKSGWNPYSTVIPTRQSADDPTYVMQFAAVDLTGILHVGMKVKWTQNGTVRYGIITAVSFSTNTLVTIYGGTDYDVLDTASFAISNFNYSLVRTPFGFPMDPAKWTQVASNSSAASQPSPVNLQWYNLGSFKLDVPIGAWNLDYNATMSGNKSGSNSEIFVGATLSTTNSSQSDTDMTSYLRTIGASASLTEHWGKVSGRKFVSVAAKTPYYLNEISVNNSLSVITLNGDFATATIRAVCAYL